MHLYSDEKVHASLFEAILVLFEGKAKSGKVVSDDVILVTIAVGNVIKITQVCVLTAETQQKSKDIHVLATPS